ncbi:MAG: hypothetical protein LBQ59_01790, partial [Candidatus Peribacteria bacterium]|nr:hypothetical protein [Candidatus Peribacteria bacterium]
GLKKTPLNPPLSRGGGKKAATFPCIPTPRGKKSYNSPLYSPSLRGKSYNSPLLVPRLLPLNLYSHPTSLSPLTQFSPIGRDEAQREKLQARE